MGHLGALACRNNAGLEHMVHQSMQNKLSQDQTPARLSLLSRPVEENSTNALKEAHLK